MHDHTTSLYTPLRHLSVSSSPHYITLYTTSSPVYLIFTTLHHSIHHFVTYLIFTTLHHSIHHFVTCLSDLHYTTSLYTPLRHLSHLHHSTSLYTPLHHLSISSSLLYITLYTTSSPVYLIFTTLHHSIHHLSTCIISDFHYSISLYTPLVTCLSHLHYSTSLYTPLVTCLSHLHFSTSLYTPLVTYLIFTSLHSIHHLSPV